MVFVWIPEHRDELVMLPMTVVDSPPQLMESQFSIRMLKTSLAKTHLLQSGIAVFGGQFDVVDDRETKADPNSAPFEIASVGIVNV